MDAGVSVKHFCLRIKVTKSVMSTVYSQLVPSQLVLTVNSYQGYLVPTVNSYPSQLVPKVNSYPSYLVPTVNSYPSYLVPKVNSYPSQLVPKLSRTHGQLVPKSAHTHGQVVPKVNSYPSTIKCTKYMKECTVELQTVKQPIQRSSQ